MNKEELLKAADLLQQFGEEIERTGEITPENAEIIDELAQRSVPIAKLINQRAFGLFGLNADTGQPVILSAITGTQVKPCQPNSTDCHVEPVDLPNDIQQALNITQPYDGKILKNGQEIPAKYVVCVAALYKGSDCWVYYINGEMIVVCYP